MLIYAGIPYLAVTIGFVALQRRLLYPATPVERIAVPRVVGGQVAEVAITTHDGLTLHGWHLAGDGAIDETAASQPTVQPLILYFPGNSEDRRSRLNDLQEFVQLGGDVLLCDYRGYGDNPGSPTEADLHADADAIWKFATVNLGRSPDEIVLFGESLGGGVATQLAARCCSAGTPPRALIVSSTFDSLPAVVARQYPLFPFRWLLFDTYRSDVAIQRVTCPIAVLHGDQDEITPIEHGRRLWASAPERSADGRAKRWMELTGRGHNDLPADALVDAMRVK
jgi:hypothetical protein